MIIYPKSSTPQEYLPYTYLLEWSAIGKRYYGCKYGEDAHPDLFWINYFTSSAEVQKYRNEYGDPDIKIIRKRFSGLTPGDQARKVVCGYENRVLTFVDAKNNSRYLNKHNGDRNFWSDVSGTVALAGRRIPQTEFQSNRDQYQTAIDGLVSASVKSTGEMVMITQEAVSYTHLTLPTILRV